MILKFYKKKGNKNYRRKERRIGIENWFLKDEKLVNILQTLFFWYNLFNYGVEISIRRRNTRYGNALGHDRSLTETIPETRYSRSNFRRRSPSLTALANIRMFAENTFSWPLCIVNFSSGKQLHDNSVNSLPCLIPDETRARVKFHRRNSRENVYGYFGKSIYWNYYIYIFWLEIREKLNYRVDSP